MTTIQTQVAEKVAYLKSVADDQGYDVANILRSDAKYIRAKKAAHYHEMADALDDAAASI